MIVPLAAGVIAGHPTTGLLVGVGAFVVASTDTGGLYRARAATMTAATLGVTAAYFLGAATASPRWLSVLLFVTVLTGSALIAAAGPGVALVSTMVTIAFVIGAFLPSSLAADAGAALALLAGGGWALGLSLAGWLFDALVAAGQPPRAAARPGRPAGDARGRAAIRAVRQPSPAVLRGAVRLAVAGGIALAVAAVFDPAHGAWLVSSTVLVLKPNVGGTLSTAAQRAAATVLGAVIAAGIVWMTSDQAALIALSFAAAALAMAVMPLSYSLGMLIITPLSILLTVVLTGSGWLVAVSRAENILIGVAIAVAASCLLFPVYAREREGRAGRPDEPTTSPD